MRRYDMTHSREKTNSREGEKKKQRQYRTERRKKRKLWEKKKKFRYVHTCRTDLYLRFAVYLYTTIYYCIL